MNSITVSTEKGKVILNLPTSIDEINPVYLTEVTEHIKVAPEYSLVALVYSTTISQVLNMKNVSANVAVVPMFVKAGKTDSEFIKGINTKDILTITSGNLSLAIHVPNSYNQLSLNKVSALLAGDDNVRKTSFSDKNIYRFIEFKLVPNCNINAVIGVHNPIKADYITEVSDTEN